METSDYQTYLSYLQRQSEHNLDNFHHLPMLQQGFGFGSIFAKLARWIIPALKLITPRLVDSLKELIIHHGASDPKKRFTKLLKQQGLKFAEDVLTKAKTQTGSGIKRKVNLKIKPKSSKQRHSQKVYKRRIKKASHTKSIKKRKQTKRIQFSQLTPHDIFG